jgi:sulfatase maturation enzyme AslB (radical SAM superfamily)
MPATMAGSRGGIIGRSEGASKPPFVKRLLSGDVEFAELVERLTVDSCPRNVTLVVNNSCNLRCGHCYLRVKELTTSALTESEWKLLIDSIASVDPELVCLSGKEVFLGNMGANLLAYLRSAKNKGASSYRIGLITNGTLVQQHTSTILQAEPSYFDISLDGLEADHDFVRGKGSFARAAPNVEWGAKTFGENFFVNLTVQRQNCNRLMEAIDCLHRRGVQNVSCGFYRPLSYTSQHLALSDQDVDLVFERLEKLEGIKLEHPLNVLLDLDIINLQALKAFLRSRWFSVDAIQEDTNGEYFIEHLLKNGIRLEFRLAPYPTGVWRSIRITPEGNYLAAEDTIDTTYYAERSIGNVRDFDYDFAALQAYGLASVRFREILSEYWDEVLPGLISVYAERDKVDLAA